MKKIKVVEIVNALIARGGIQVFFANLCCSLKKNTNLELTVISLYSDINEAIAEQFKAAGINVITCGKRNKFDIKASLRLRKILMDINPDVVNFHSNFYLSYFLAFGFRKRAWKLIKTYHSVPYTIAKIDKYFEKKYIKKNNLDLIGISNSISNQISEMHNQKIEPFTIYNGVNIVYNSKDICDPMFDFIIVASMSPVKNHKLLFSSFADLCKKYPSATLLCVGGGALLNENKNFVSSLGLSKNITFTGPVNNVHKYLEISKTLVLSSKSEGNPICILEALGHGLQIVAPNIGGIPDVIDNGINGYLYETDNKEELTKCLFQAYLGKDRELFKKNNIKKSKKYSMDLCAENYFDVFCKILYIDRGKK